MDARIINWVMLAIYIIYLGFILISLTSQNLALGFAQTFTSLVTFTLFGLFTAFTIALGLTAGRSIYQALAARRRA